MEAQSKDVKGTVGSHRGSNYYIGNNQCQSCRALEVLQRELENRKQEGDLMARIIIEKLVK